VKTAVGLVCYIASNSSQRTRAFLFPTPSAGVELPSGKWSEDLCLLSTGHKFLPRSYFSKLAWERQSYHEILNNLILGKGQYITQTNACRVKDHAADLAELLYFLQDILVSGGRSDVDAPSFDLNISTGAHELENGGAVSGYTGTIARYKGNFGEVVFRKDRCCRDANSRPAADKEESMRDRHFDDDGNSASSSRI
jgi:hypothetical protein